MNNYTLFGGDQRSTRHEDMKAAVDYIRTQSFVISSVVPPILVIVGTVGNILVLLTVRRIDLPAAALVVYLKTFLVMSTLVLLLFPGMEWMLAKIGVTPLVDTSDTMCRLWKFVGNVVMYSPMWIAVTMIVDQCVSLWRPKMALSVSTRFSAKLITAVLFVGLITVGVHSLWTHELGPTTKRCHEISVEGYYHNVVWPWLTLLLLVICPLLILLPCNIAVILGLCLKTHLSSSSAGATSNRAVDEFRICVLIITCCIFLASAPTTIITVLAIQMPRNWIAQSSARLVAFRMADLIFQMLTMSYYSIAFPLFLVLSSTFRRAFLDCSFCPRRRTIASEDEENARLNNEKNNPSTTETCLSKNYGVTMNDLSNRKNKTPAEMEASVDQETLL